MSLPELENAITNMDFSALEYKSKAVDEQPHLHSKTKFNFPVMEDLENWGNVPSPSQAI